MVKTFNNVGKFIEIFYGQISYPHANGASHGLCASLGSFLVIQIFTDMCNQSKYERILLLLSRILVSHIRIFKYDVL